MKKMCLLKFPFVLVLVIVLSQGCKVLTKNNSEIKNPTIELFIYQNGKELLVDPSLKWVEIEKGEFSLRFYNKRYNYENKEFYSAQIAAFLDQSEINNIQIGMSKSALPCFEPGSGMAPSKSGKYETLIFNNSGHHYATYENEESKRLNLIDDNGELLKLEFDIAEIYYDNTEYKMSEISLDKFYIAFLIDRNLNGVIDEGELLKLFFKVK